jgi:glycosyltransferase involved in cell wall biosynthesis
MNKTSLSVTIITLNEEKKLPTCLKSIKNLADEIVVVDSGSADGTVGIAKNFNARVFERKFDNYSNQKNYAASKATGNWILSLDADEEISPKLAEEIKRAIIKDGCSAYSIPRKNIIFGKFIKYTRWQPELDRHVWLWQKSRGVWKGDVHEELEVKGKIGRLKHSKIHYQYENIKEFIDMMSRYSELEAKEKVKNGIRFSYFRLFYDPIYNFLVRYIYRWGFLDGWRGLVLSCLMAVYHLEVWIKVWEGQSK